MLVMRHDLGDLPELLDSVDLVVGGVISGLTYDPEILALTLVIKPASEDPAEPWARRIRCGHAIHWRVGGDLIDAIAVSDDHPALLPFTDDHGELFFRGAPADPERVADRLRAAHASVADDYIRFDDTVNQLPLGELLVGGHGKLATGPVTLLRGLEQVLEAAGVSPRLLVTPKIDNLDAQAGIPARGPLSFLDLGESFVIANAFRVEDAAE
jgi:hypothetical protein